MDLSSNTVEEELDRYADGVLNIYSKPTATRIENPEETSTSTTDITRNQNCTMTILNLDNAKALASSKGNTSNNNLPSSSNVQNNGQNAFPWNQNSVHGSNVFYGGHQSSLPHYAPTNNASFGYNYNYPPVNNMYPQAPISQQPPFYQQYDYSNRNAYPAANLFNNYYNPRFPHYQNWNFQPPYQNTARYMNAPAPGPNYSNANARETRIDKQKHDQHGPNEGGGTCVVNKNKPPKARSWSKREDAALLRLIEKFTVNGNIFWDGVSSNYKDRTKFQIFYRYKTLMQKEKKQKSSKKVKATR